ncbi:hypothetical protein PGTUg99_003545 [Puccinia graminis f. sp. tritici]|nr:hypothetical protein PGTUg99_015116 [Puccinia graminis f. sp. tritici]KAA1118308.1 hypothetical protein PGTUg99_003545 [Puccinia graminis f. sp. tritici]
MWACKTRGSECEESSKRPEESQEEESGKEEQTRSSPRPRSIYHPSRRRIRQQLRLGPNGKWLSSKKQTAGKSTKTGNDGGFAPARSQCTTEARTRPEPMQGTQRFLRSGKRDADGDEDE